MNWIKSTRIRLALRFILVRLHAEPHRGCAFMSARWRNVTPCQLAVARAAPGIAP